MSEHIVVTRAFVLLKSKLTSQYPGLCPVIGGQVIGIVQLKLPQAWNMIRLRPKSRLLSLENLVAFPFEINHDPFVTGSIDQASLGHISDAIKLFAVSEVASWQ